MHHSRWTSTLGSAIAAAATLLLAACGSSSSTAPNAQAAAKLAAYYDGLASAHLAAGTDADSLDWAFISILNGPIAYGQLPANVNISASGTAQTWFANAAMFVDSAQTDSIIVISWWADTVVSSFMIAFTEGNTLPGLDADEFYLSSGVTSNADSSSVTVAAAGKSGSCASNITITNVYSAYPTYDPANTKCTPATLTVAGHLHFPAQTGIASQYQDVDLPSTALSGVRLQATHGATFSRVRALPHGMIRVN